MMMPDSFPCCWKCPQSIQQFLIGVGVVPFGEDDLGRRKHLGINDGLERAITPGPGGRLVDRAALLEFGAGSIVDVVADVLLVCKNLSDA